MKQEETTATEQQHIKIPQYTPPRINQIIFPKSSIWERARVYNKTLANKKKKIALVVFLIPGLALLPIKALYNLLKKSWDYASDFFAILTNIR